MEASSSALGSRYELQEQIGRGATGDVWRAWDRVTNSPVAAKILSPQFATDREVLTRFIAERTILLGLDHPNIVKVRDLVVEGDRLAIVMDLVSGPSLGRFRKQVGTLPASHAVPLVAAALDGLAFAHSKNVVHRDVKPDNILLADPVTLHPAGVRLVDFGIAWLAKEGAVQGAEHVGTPLYMAPEQVADGKAEPASDVYAAGVVLYELLGGRSPFAGEADEVAIALRHLQSAPPRLPVDERLWRLLTVMLAKDPAGRPTAPDAAGALRSLPAAALPTFQLPVQATPEQFSRAADARPDLTEAAPDTAGKLRSFLRRNQPAAPSESPAFDPNSTGVKARRDLPAPAPEAPAPAPVDEAEVGSGTQVKSVQHHRVATAAQPEAAKRRRWPWIAAGAVVLAGATVGVLFLTGVLGGPAPEPEAPVITTAAAHTTGDSYPTGLRMDLDARYDASSEVTDVTLTLATAPTVSLAGDVFVVIPGLGSTCPAVTAQSGEIVPVTASKDGIDVDCAYRIQGLQLDAGRSTVVDLAVDLDLIGADGTMPADYAAWLSSIESATDSGLGHITGTAFPLQRVDGISVTAESVSMDENAGIAVPYQVYAQWDGPADASPDTQILSQDTLDGMETQLLLALTGGAGLDGVTVGTCNEAQLSGIRVLAMQPTDNCFVHVQIGALDSGQSRFTIAMRQ